jgi:hypothetical protein
MPLKAYLEAHNVEVVVGAHFGKCNSLKSRTVASYRDPRDWIDILRQQGEVEEIRGTSWDLEIGALIEIACRESAGYPPSLLFRDIPGYASDRRVPTSLA